MATKAGKQEGLWTVNINRRRRFLPGLKSGVSAPKIL